jgi:isohexenylglutaconyl-CoA hydratase
MTTPLPSTFSTLRVHTQHGVCTLTLNRPDVRNAMSLTMVNELLGALHHAESSGDVRLIVLRGAGGHFCAGGDIADMAQARMKLAALRSQGHVADGQANASDPVAEFNAQFGRLCLAYARTHLPVITVLEGTVMGGGFGLACVADVSLALHTTVFRLPETSLGVIPAQIAPFLVERLGPSQARRLAITGAKVLADQALAMGLVHEVAASADALDSALHRTVLQVLACAPQAIGTTKDLMARARFERADQLIEDAARLFSQAVLSEEGQEGTQAFLQKRAPAWVPTQA